MSYLATTKLSSKGQVVIPEEIRNMMGLHTGDNFIVVAEKDIVILKAITQPSFAEFDALIAKARKQAVSAKVTKKALQNAIEEVRKK